MKPEIIAFDADDTLWSNESFFQDIEAEYCQLLSQYLPADEVSKKLFKTEMQNLSIYGYGVKSFTLSMIETAIRISGGQISAPFIENIIDFGKRLLNMPVEILPGVKMVLESLHGRYKLVVATKGDLLNQKRKLERSGLKDYFHHIEIMSDKKVEDYRNLMQALNCPAEKFLMIGNSIKSDILPVLELGGHAIHVPFEVTWAHEKHTDEINHPGFAEVRSMEEVLEIIG